MSFYYDFSGAYSTNSSADTEDKMNQWLTVSNGRRCAITALYSSGRNATGTAIVVRLKTADTTAGTGGSGVTPTPRDPDSPAADTGLVSSGFTPGSTLVQRQHCGVNAQGGMGGWFAGDLDMAIKLSANGGADGNAELYNISPGTTIPFEFTSEFAEL